ncbi:phosphatase PAP2 family protein [Chryseobacterium oryctis]|uniref:Phosphatase PAP2 family protein n=1 Tax=Chryseobacterium oryctis TaxID=2952618 RepID=A0ABT3HRD2_9FLAO|nr:phosphatase PAP2 family protein [Chryseobacterium oryctis]MCW3162235.1 phosphatase PAP2 family protein [Chryseobacterium oryctis]
MSIKEYSFKDSVSYFLPILLMIIVPVVIWITWHVKTGRYTNMDVSDRTQRKTLYVFIAICVLAYLVYNYVKNDYVDFLMLFILILVFVLQISNLFIKSSMHTAFNIFVAALFFVLDWKMGIIWLGIAFLVGITRIILKRHTPKEVLMGALIAFMISFIYLYCNIQFQH